MREFWEVPMEPMTLDELAAFHGIQPIASVDELVVDLGTDEDLDTSRRSRNQDDGAGDRA